MPGPSHLEPPALRFTNRWACGSPKGNLGDRLCRELRAASQPLGSLQASTGSCSESERSPVSAEGGGEGAAWPQDSEAA